MYDFLIDMVETRATKRTRESQRIGKESSLVVVSEPVQPSNFLPSKALIQSTKPIDVECGEFYAKIYH